MTRTGRDERGLTVPVVYEEVREVDTGEVLVTAATGNRGGTVRQKTVVGTVR